MCDKRLISCLQIYYKYIQYTYPEPVSLYKKSYSNKIKTNYLKKYLNHLLEILLIPNLCILVLDYYVLYYNLCDECYNSNRSLEFYDKFEYQNHI